jgi:hypothetical protein
VSLGLNLSESRAKLARARVHLESAKAEFQRISAERHPYLLRITEINPDGWCSVIATPTGFPQERVGVVAGDIVHNLRSALDYIVTALVDRSAATLMSKHEFPIFLDAKAYVKNVGDPMKALPGGKLGGIVYGLQEIWRLQPFNEKPDPADSALLRLQWLSNADKHRRVIESEPYISGDSVVSLVHTGTLLEQIKIPIADSEYREYEVYRLKFALPAPTQVKIDNQENLRTRIRLVAKPFGRFMPRFPVTSGVMENLCDHVAMIVDLFKKL